MPTAPTTIQTASATRSSGLERLEHERYQLHQAFADAVRAAVAAGDCSVTQAAKEAGMSRQSLYEILNRYPDSNAPAA